MTVDEFIKTKVRSEFIDIVEAIRNLMREVVPTAKEFISYGIPMYKGKKYLAVISPTKKDITFSFSRGAEFRDKYNLLQGVGKVSKHIKIQSLDDFNPIKIKYYIKQAKKLDELVTIN